MRVRASYELQQAVVCDANGSNVKHQNTSGAFRHVLASAVCADDENTGITEDDEDRSGLRNGPFAAVTASSSSRSDESPIVDEKLGVCRVYTRRKARISSVGSARMRKRIRTVSLFDGSVTAAMATAPGDSPTF